MRQELGGLFELVLKVRQKAIIADVVSESQSLVPTSADRTVIDCLTSGCLEVF